MKATFTKLRDGEWGVRIEGGHPTKGDTVSVEKKNGGSSMVTLQRRLWKGNEGLTLWTLQKKEPCAECGERPGAIEAQDSSGLWGRICGKCAEQTRRVERSFA